MVVLFGKDMGRVTRYIMNTIMRVGVLQSLIDHKGLLLNLRSSTCGGFRPRGRHELTLVCYTCARAAHQRTR